MMQLHPPPVSEADTKPFATRFRPSDPVEYNCLAPVPLQSLDPTNRYIESSALFPSPPASPRRAKVFPPSPTSPHQPKTISFDDFSGLHHQPTTTSFGDSSGLHTTESDPALTRTKRSMYPRGAGASADSFSWNPRTPQSNEAEAMIASYQPSDTPVDPARQRIPRNSLGLFDLPAASAGDFESFYPRSSRNPILYRHRQSLLLTCAPYPSNSTSSPVNVVASGPRGYPHHEPSPRVRTRQSCSARLQSTCRLA